MTSTSITNIERLVFNILEEFIDNKDIQISKQSDLVDDLNFDSLDMLKLIYEFESALNLKINDVYLVGLTTVESLIVQIEKIMKDQ